MSKHKSRSTQPNHHAPVPNGPVGVASSSTTSDYGQKTQFSVLLYNIFFDKDHLEERMDAIADLIATHSPDVVALQEVTAENFARLQTHPVIQTYHWAAPDFSRTWYSTALGSKTEFLTPPQRLPFSETKMGRDLLWVHLELTRSGDGSPFDVAIGTFHLESVKSAAVKQKQLQEACHVLETCENTIVCGDTNFLESDLGLPEGWVDGWLHLGHSHWDGPTYDCVKNTMISHRGTNRQRYDRLFMYPVTPSSSTSIKPTAKSNQPNRKEGTRSSALTLKYIRIVGNIPILKDLFPSDHFGLLSVYEM